MMESLTGGFMRKLSKQDGFTLLELVIVLASVVLLAALILAFRK